MLEPKKQNDINLLVPYLIPKYQAVLDAMKKRGHHPVIVESLRSKERQRWLYGQGRSKLACIRAGISPAYSRSGPIVTYTLDSKHIVGKACDIIDKYTGYKDPYFFADLKIEARKQDLKTLGFELCHVEWS